ncbi:DUF6953 family protein [Acinetobacter lwoffii]|uniref:DUF6953 family protein n=1 Tax=Acinetobacter lwoffii TaxID=28090 RepID=UPI003B981AA5
MAVSGSLERNWNLASSIKVSWYWLKRSSKRGLLPVLKLNLGDVIQWMIENLEKDGCLYQEDVVDYLVKNNQMDLLKENTDGNVALQPSVNNAFKKKTEHNVVWVKPDRYWRYRVPEDELGREARG